MSVHKTFFLFCLMIIPFFVFAQSTETVKTDTVKQNESFNPISLGDYDIDLEQPVVDEKDVVNIDDILQGDAQDTTGAADQVVPGFRIQLVSTRDEEEARNIRRDALLTFSEKVYLSFDDPYYKVRIGDCLSRFEANDMQEMARSKGFFEAWVVRTNVRSHTELGGVNPVKPGEE
jgi:hypothetical protein